MDLAGYVWEDIAQSKASERNDLYEVSSNDIRIGGITVYLKKNGNIIAKRKTNTTNIDKSNKIGEYFFPAKGDYEIDDNNLKTWDYEINISELSQYSIEFEYNGLKYENVVTNLDVANGSKAAETENNRSTVNINYHNINGGTAKTTKTTGVTGEGTSLTYTSGNNYNSELVQNTAYTAESVSGSTDVDAARIYADTKTAEYTFAWSTGVRVIRNINLGIYEREQPDLAVVTDIDNVQLSINGYNHTYNYKQRASYENQTGVPDSEINAGYDATMDGFSVYVKNNTNNYKNLTYTRDVYDSYIAYTKNDKDNTDRLRMFVTYKLVVKNETSALVSRVALRNYADIRYNRVESSIMVDSDGGQTELANDYWKTVGTINSGKTNIWETDGLLNVDIPSGKMITVYLKYEVSTDTIIEMANLQSNGGSNIEFTENTTEIFAYSTWKNGAYYAGIDKDSAPNNITYMQINTYEDDTDAAPGFKIERKDSKIIEGYDGNQKKTVIKSTNGDVEVTTQNYKSTIVDEAKFRTLIDNNVENPNIQLFINDFNTKRNNTALWYWYQHSTNFVNSSAVDNKTLRDNINNHLETIDYKVKTTYDTKSDISGVNSQYYYMIANTGIMDFAIEDIQEQKTEFDYKEGERNYQIKFGIIERPRQSLQVNKEICNIKLTLANGQILAQGDPRNETINYVTYPENGSLKIEVDSEIIEGATLDIDYEITVDNKSEKDYVGTEYYRYGLVNENNLVKITLNSIADYVDERLSVTYDDIENSIGDFRYYNTNNNTLNQWQLIRDVTKEEKMLTGINIDPSVYSSIKTRSNIVVRDTDISLAPEESTTLNLLAKKLLNNLSEDQVFDNYVELIQVSNPVGRFYGNMVGTTYTYMTPGNFNVTTKIKDESDNSNYNRQVKRNAQVIIIPPTGVKEKIQYVSIGVGCLILLAGGIWLIKKKVLD